ATVFNDLPYAACTGYKGTTPPYDSWLISPAVDLSKVTDKKLSFDTQVNGYGSTTTVFEVYVMTSADPATATKTKLNPALPTAPDSGY
ncbi:choice-of-anchor J domain-containing protein, partial [Bacillus pumilus]